MSWIWGEVVLVALLSGAMALFATAPFLPTVYALPAVREVLDTAVLFTSAAVSVLAALRFLVERLRLDLLLACGFFVAAATTLLFALPATLALFAELREVFTPLVTRQYVSQADFLRLLSYCVLLAGVWRAIRASEFGLAVAEERARVAREIHDGLPQYLFAVSTQ